MKIQTAFRFEETLIKELKEKAKGQRRSLNNYIEYILYKSIGNLPNEETLKSIKEFNSDKLEEIENVDKFMDNL